MRFLISLTFMCLLLHVALKPTTANFVPINSKAFQALDTSKYAILESDSRWRKYFLGDYSRQTTLDVKEIALIEKLIHQYSLRYNATAIKNAKANTASARKRFKSTKYTEIPELVTETNLYYKQFIPGINAKLEKEVYLICFRLAEDKTNWKSVPVFITGGGSNYFKAKINLTRSMVSDFWVNAPY